MILLPLRSPAVCRIVFIAGLALMTAATTAAQKPAVQSSLSPASQAHLTQTVPVSKFNLIHVEGGIIDADLNIWRAGFGLAPSMSVRETPEATARAWVDQYGRAYGIKTSSHLKVIREVRAHGVSHVTFQQMSGETPVYERYVHINLGQNGLPTMVHSGYAPHIDDIVSVTTQLGVSEMQAHMLAGAAVTSGSSQIHASGLYLYPEPIPRLIWSVTVSPVQENGSWRVLVDAQTGALVGIIDLVMHRSNHAQEVKSRPIATADTVTGRGLIWDPDPLTMAGVMYGGSYRDNNDQNNGLLADKLMEVELLNITLGADSLYRLEGPYVKLEETAGRYSPPAVAQPDAFMFHRDNDHFESVMAYYHLHSSQLYIQSLDVGRPVAADTVTVKMHGTTEDNSFYDSAKNEFVFGSGGVDDGEDVEVMLHEYGHAVLHSGTAVNIGSGPEGGAYHEGFADYWAVSYTRNLIENGVVPPRDWRQIFDWDAGIDRNGDWSFWPGRYVAPNRTYATASCRSSSEKLCDKYDDGLILLDVLMQIWGSIGRHQTDRLILFSHAYLGLPFTMESAIQALVQADIDLNAGNHVALINRLFRDSAYPTHIAQAPKSPISLSLQPNYPNPFTTITNFTYSLDRTAQVRVEVFNVLGQRVMVYRDTIESAGLHTHTLDLSKRPAGVYILRVTTGDRQLSQPLLLVR